MEERIEEEEEEEEEQFQCSGQFECRPIYQRRHLHSTSRTP